MDIMINDKEDEIIKEHFWSPLSRCQIEFKKSLKSTHFMFHCVNFFQYKCLTKKTKRD